MPAIPVPLNSHLSHIMNEGKLTPDQVAAYHRDGYVIVKGLFDREEIDLLRKACKTDKALDDHAFGRDDGSGAKVRLSLWNHPGEGIYGMFARCHKLVDSVEQLLGDEAYHYHSKMIMKDAKVGGAWAWHQDYGYWYGNGCLFPDMGSCMIAVDRATKENGCLQVVRGSHLMGRMDHGKVGDQTGADPERVAAALERLELVYCELEPGSAIFFHSNTLHRSDQNTSDHPRWAFICCYNTQHNDPYKESKHPHYSPLETWDDSRVAEIGCRQWEEMK